MEKQQDNDYPKHGVCPTDLETGDQELKHCESKDQLTKGGLDLLQHKPDPFFLSEYPITSDW